jgi:hypothetical protein
MRALARQRQQPLEARGDGLDADSAGVTGHRPDLELELVLLGEALMTGQKGVLDGLVRVVGQRVELGHAPPEVDGTVSVQRSADVV